MKKIEEKRILISDKFTQEALIKLQNQTFLKIHKTQDFSLKKENISEIEAFIIRSRTQITEEILKKAKNLQLIVTCTSGFDHIDLEACKQWGITVMHTPHANVNSACELTWGLVLSCARKIITSNRSIKSGENARELLTGLELANKTYGVVGLGRIGRRVLRIAKAFGMETIAYDPYLEDCDFEECGAERVSYEEILKRSDVLSFHVPKTLETHHMLNRSHFEFMNRNLILINTSRGSIFCEEDLSHALDKQWLTACGLDVFEKEPLPRNSPLLHFNNVVLTPHTGALTQEAFTKASEEAAQKVILFFLDGSTSDTLPPQVPWYGANKVFRTAISSHGV